MNSSSEFLGPQPDGGHENGSDDDSTLNTRRTVTGQIQAQAEGQACVLPASSGEVLQKLRNWRSRSSSNTDVHSAASRNSIQLTRTAESQDVRNATGHDHTARSRRSRPLTFEEMEALHTTCSEVVSRAGNRPNSIQTTSTDKCQDDEFDRAAMDNDYSPSWLTLLGDSHSVDFKEFMEGLEVMERLAVMEKLSKELKIDMDNSLKLYTTMRSFLLEFLETWESFGSRNLCEEDVLAAEEHLNDMLTIIEEILVQVIRFDLHRQDLLSLVMGTEFDRFDALLELPLNIQERVAKLRTSSKDLMVARQRIRFGILERQREVESARSRNAVTLAWVRERSSLRAEILAWRNGETPEPCFVPETSMESVARQSELEEVVEGHAQSETEERLDNANVPGTQSPELPRFDPPVAETTILKSCLRSRGSTRRFTIRWPVEPKLKKVIYVEKFTYAEDTKEDPVANTTPVSSPEIHFPFPPMTASLGSLVSSSPGSVPEDQPSDVQLPVQTQEDQSSSDVPEAVDVLWFVPDVYEPQVNRRIPLSDGLPEFEDLEAYIVKLDELPEVKNQKPDFYLDYDKVTAQTRDEQYMTSYLQMLPSTTRTKAAASKGQRTITVNILEGMGNFKTSTWKMNVAKFKNPRHGPNRLKLLRDFLTKINVASPNCTPMAGADPKNEVFHILETSIFGLTERQKHCFFRALEAWGFTSESGTVAQLSELLEGRRVRYIERMIKFWNLRKIHPDVFPDKKKRRDPVKNAILDVYVDLEWKPKCQGGNLSSPDSDKLLTPATEPQGVPMSSSPDPEQPPSVQTRGIHSSNVPGTSYSSQVVHEPISLIPLDDGLSQFEDLVDYVTKLDGLPEVKNPKADLYLDYERLMAAREDKKFMNAILLPSPSISPFPATVSSVNSKKRTFTIHVLDGMSNYVIATWKMAVDKRQNPRHGPNHLKLLRHFLTKANERRPKVKAGPESKDEVFYISETTFFYWTDRVKSIFFRALEMWGFQSASGMNVDQSAELLEGRKVRYIGQMISFWNRGMIHPDIFRTKKRLGPFKKAILNLRVGLGCLTWKPKGQGRN